MKMNLGEIGTMVCGESCGMIQSIVPYPKNKSMPKSLSPDDFVRHQHVALKMQERRHEGGRPE